MSSMGTSTFPGGEDRKVSVSGETQPPTPRGAQLAVIIGLSVLLCVILGSCHGFFISPTLSSIFITPASASVAVTNTVQLVATGRYSDGSQGTISGNNVGWSSSSNTVATVTSPGGLVTGVAVGTATITAGSQGITATANVSVTPSNVTSLVITTNQGSTTPITTATISGTGGTLQFYAYANNTTNDDVTQAVNWVSSNSTVASIVSGQSSGNGLVTAASAGTTNITASITNSTTGQTITSQTVVLTVQ